MELLLREYKIVKIRNIFFEKNIFLFVTKIQRIIGLMVKQKKKYSYNE